MSVLKTRKDFDEYNEALPSNIVKEFDDGKAYKSALGYLGLYEQTKLNEKFMLGEQWAGAEIGDMPTPVMNIIRQIGEYKIANLVSNPVEFMYSFEGVPSYLEQEERANMGRIQDTLNAVDAVPLIGENEQAANITAADELNAVADALGAHAKTIWERAQMDMLNQTGARKAWISGTYVLYCPFDANLKTGLYGKDGETPIKGDIAPELLDIANVYFGNPAETDVQKQPYIIIAQRKGIRDIARLAKLHNATAEAIEKIVADGDTGYEAGNIDEDTISKKATLLTKFWREYKEDGSYEVKCIQVCKDSVIRKEFSTGISLYPLAVFQWNERDNCIYGHSEVTELIANQVCINRLLALEILGTMLVGMPKIIFNGDVIDGTLITNEPGEKIEVRGNQDVQASIRYLNPAQISPNWNNIQQGMIENTKNLSGATNAALGDLRPENTSAIIALREAATLPLQPMLNRFYAFVEQVARIWGETILNKYGERKLKISKDGKVYYVPFDAMKYKDLLLSVRIEVGASNLWSASTIIATLNNLLMLGKIDIVDFLERIPDGYITRKQDLINSIKQRVAEAQQMAAMQAQMESQVQGAQQQEPQMNLDALLDGLDDEQLAALRERPDILESVMGGTAGQPV